MDSFDLGRLTGHDFEVVCRDLFSEILGVPLEVFPGSRDGGIDLRHMASPENSVIVQCKHWQHSGQAKLVRQMTTVELAKIRRLSPRRYVLATSAELTVDGKNKLLSGLQPYVQGTGDLYGLDQIVEELRLRPELVERHFRLWLSSTAVLHTMLNKDAVLRSHWLRDDLARTAEIFVPHDGFRQARDVLAREHVCVITGVPGIGKTTIAGMLALRYLHDGYQVYEISEDVSEITDLWRDDTPQLFYYDDFLGQTTLLNKNEDARLEKVMRKVRATPGKAMILTTREYILEQARQRHRRLGEAELTPVISVVRLSDLTWAVRANILYNHVYRADIPVEEKRSFADQVVWKPIIRHRNFNPRLIERTLEIGESDRASAMIANLDDPRRIWERIVEDELSDAAVHILEVMLTYSRVPLETLEEAWSSYRRELGLTDDARTFRRELRILEGTMISFRAAGEISFHNPSIADYLRHHMNSGRTRIRPLVTSLINAEQVVQLMNVATGHDAAGLLRLLRENSDAVVDTILDTEDTVEYSPSDEDYSSVEHLEWMLDMAELLNSDRLARYVRWNVEYDVAGPAPDSHAVSLAEALVQSELIPEDVSYRYAVRTAAEVADSVEELIDYSWSMAHERYEIVRRLWQYDREAIDDVHMKLGEAAVRELKELLAAGQPDSRHIYTIEVMLDFLSDHSAGYELSDDEMAQLEAMAKPSADQLVSDTCVFDTRASTPVPRRRDDGEQQAAALMAKLADLTD